MYWITAVLVVSFVCVTSSKTLTKEDAYRLGPDILNAYEPQAGRFGTRPSSKHEPVDTPPEVVDPRLDPPRDFLVRFGHTIQRYQSRYWKSSRMALTRPEESITHPNGTVDWQMKRGQLRAPRSFMRNIGYTKLSPNGPRLRLRIKSKSRKKVRHYLHSYTHCPLQYVWKDLGQRFYPRWLKVSQCYKGRSCSIPAGMQCYASKSSHLVVLRYYCNNNYECRWLQMKYKVVTECSCGC